MKIRISESAFRYGFFLLLLFRPASYIIGETAEKICMGILCALSVYYFVMAILRYRRGIYQPSKTMIMLVLFFGWCMIGSTCMNYIFSNSVSFNYAVSTFLCELGVIIVSDMELDRSPRQYIRLFISIGGFFSLINALTMFIYGYSGGLNTITQRDNRTISSNYFFFAEDNATFFLVLPVLVLTWIYYFRYKRTRKMLIWSVFFTVITTASYVYMWSVNNMIGCFVIILLILFYWRKSRKENVKVKKKHIVSVFDIGWISAVIFNYLIVVQRVFMYFSDFILNTLDKSITLGGRIPVWEKSLYYIKEQPLIGFGYETRSVTLSKIIFNHTHNIVLEILYRGGIIGLVLFIVLLIVMGRKVKQYQSSAIVMFLGMCVVLFLFLSTIEFAFYRYPYIVMFVLLGRCDVLFDQKKTLREVRDGAI